MRVSMPICRPGAQNSSSTAVCGTPCHSATPRPFISLIIVWSFEFTVSRFPLMCEATDAAFYNEGANAVSGALLSFILLQSGTDIVLEQQVWGISDQSVTFINQSINCQFMNSEWMSNDSLLPGDGCLDMVECDGDADRLVLHHVHHVGLIRDDRGLFKVRACGEHYITCNLVVAFIQSNLQLIRLSIRHTPWSNVGLRALLKGPTLVQMLSWPHQGSNHQPCGLTSSSLTTTLQAEPEPEQKLDLWLHYALFRLYHMLHITLMYSFTCTEKSYMRNIWENTSYIKYLY